MGTSSRYPQRVARSPWVPDDSQRELLARVKAAAQEIAEAEARYKALLTACEESDIPIAHIAAELGVQRKTIYRHLGRSMT